MDRRGGSLWVVLLAGLLLSGCSEPETAEVLDSAPARLAPTPETAGPLEVTSQERLGERSTRYFFDAELIDPGQIADGRPSVVVTLPADYDPNLDYPVLYLLHGTDSSATSWLEEGGVENAAEGLEAIVVQPEGGETGWYTDWAVQSEEPKYWRSQHLDQVVPWVDSQFATIDDRKARAIAGASAGGYGSMSYAEQRPEVFGTVISFSGVLSLEDASIRGIAEDEFARATGNGNDVLGNGQETTEQQWQDADPGLHAGRLEDTAIAVYRGSSERYESVLGATTDRFIERAEEDGISVESYEYENLFERDQQMPNDSYCTGGHEWSCWSGALKQAVPFLREQMGDPR